MPRGLTRTLAAADADPHASDVPHRQRRRSIGYAAIGLVAYVAALVASWPARFLIDADPRWVVSGTIWHGEALLDGAYRVEWRWAPIRSLANLGFATDWRLTGSATDLAGSAVATPGRLVLDGISGRGDAGLLAALSPDLPFVCDAGLTVQIRRLVLAGGRSAMDGAVRSDAGRCAAPGSEGSRLVPPLIVRARPDDRQATITTLAPAAQPRLTLVEASLAGGRLAVAPTRAGIALLPFLRNWRIDRRW